MHAMDELSDLWTSSSSLLLRNRKRLQRFAIMEGIGDESAAKLPRRKQSGIKSFLFGKSGSGHKFYVSPVRSKENSGEDRLVKCSNHRSGGNSKEISWENHNDNNSEEHRFLRKPRMNLFGRSFSWMKWNFLTSLISDSSSSSSSGQHSSAADKREESNAAEISNCGREFVHKTRERVIQETKSHCSSVAGFSRGKENFNELNNSETEKTEDVDNCISESVHCAENAIAEEDRCSCMGTHAGEYCSDGEYGRITRRREFRRFPPPLPSLARTGNLPCHMPWVLLRSYSADGRLVLQEVKLRRHEFFRAERSNGRLTLQLVQHDEDKVRAHQAEMFSNAEVNRIRSGDAVEEEEDDDDDDDDDRSQENENLEANDEIKDEDVGVFAEEDVNVDGEDEKLSTELPKSRFGSFNGGRETANRQIQCFSPNLFGGTSSPHAHSVQSSGGIGIESPVGCCALPKNSLFQMSFPTIRPILS